jgi:hypothetical protein
MKITTQSRLALLAGLSLLALMVFATGVQAAQAATVAESGAGSGTVFTTPHELQAPTAAAPAGTQGSTAVRRDAHAGRTTQVASASTAQSVSSRTVWIVAGSAAAALIVILAWVLVRSRRQPGGRPSAAYCAQHPGDPLCRTT